MTRTNDIALTNGFTPLTEPAARIIAEGLLTVANAAIAAVRWSAARLKPATTHGTTAPMAPHAALVMEPARFVLGR